MSREDLIVKYVDDPSNELRKSAGYLEPIEWYPSGDYFDWTRPVLAILENRGILLRRGQYTDIDGQPTPTYLLVGDPEQFDRELERAEADYTVILRERQEMITVRKPQ